MVSVRTVRRRAACAGPALRGYGATASCSALGVVVRLLHPAADRRRGHDCYVGSPCGAGEGTYRGRVSALLLVEARTSASSNKGIRPGAARRSARAIASCSCPRLKSRETRWAICSSTGRLGERLDRVRPVSRAAERLPESDAPARAEEGRQSRLRPTKAILPVRMRARAISCKVTVPSTTTSPSRKSKAASRCRSAGLCPIRGAAPR